VPIRVSVLLPVYNGVKYLSSAIESVLSQTYSDFELLIFDDCSDDDSQDLIQFYARRDKRIIVRRNEVRKGLFGNYNNCLKHASGEFIKPFAQDDVLAPEMLEHAVQVMDDFSQVALLSVGRRFIDWSGMEHTDLSSMPSAGDLCGSNKVVPARELMEKSLFPVRNIIGEPASIMFRRSSIGEGFDESFHHLGDLDYWLRILKDGDFFYLPEKLVEFRRHAESTSHHNVSQLLFIPDVWRMGIKHELLLRSLGRSRDEYQHDAIINLARYTDYLVSSGEVNAEGTVLADPSQDMDYFRAIALHALRALGRSQDGQSNFFQCRQHARSIKFIRSREKKVQALLSSKSWHATKILRDINKLFGVVSQGDTIEETLNFNHMGNGVEQQREYITSLRRLHRRVTRSRSWAVTKPFRALGRKVEPLLSIAAQKTRLEQIPRIEQTLRTEQSPSIGQTQRTEQIERSNSQLTAIADAHAKTPSQTYLAMAAIFRNEGPYLREWLEFHRLIGVEKFYLFNNLSTDDFALVLQPYVDDGIVELIDWPVESTSVAQWNSIQCTVYNTAARLALGRTKWLAFLDIDEFLVPLVESNLKRVLVEYEPYGGLCANWRLFGTSGIRAVGQGDLLIENLTRSAAADHPDHSYVKSIIQPDRVAQCTDPHFWMYKEPFGQVTPEGLPFIGSLSPSKKSDKIRINHYRLRDELGYEMSKRKRYSVWQYGNGLDQKYCDELNQVEDRAILRFVPELKARLGGG